MQGWKHWNLLPVEVCQRDGEQTGVPGKNPSTTCPKIEWEWEKQWWKLHWHHSFPDPVPTHLSMLFWIKNQSINQSIFYFNVCSHQGDIRPKQRKKKEEKKEEWIMWLTTFNTIRRRCQLPIAMPLRVVWPLQRPCPEPEAALWSRLTFSWTQEWVLGN